MTSSLLSDVHAVYDALPAMDGHPHLSVIHPHVGGAYLDARPGALRVVAVGVNSYVDAADESGSTPDWFPGWVRARCHAFFPRLHRECEAVAAALSGSPAYAGLTYGGLDSLYATNAVKRHLPRAGGRWAHDVEGRWLDEGEAVWRAELDAMARQGVVPHVVIVFGRRIWGRCWRAFGGGVSPDGWIAAYRPMPPGSPLYHRLNVVAVREGDRERPLLLLRLTHPAAPTSRWRAAELTAHPDFRRVVGLC